MNDPMQGRIVRFEELRKQGSAVAFIDSPTASCSQPDSRSDSCWITWPYLWVSTAEPAYIISMTVAIDGQIVANHRGFFQSSMYVPG